MNNSRKTIIALGSLFIGVLLLIGLCTLLADKAPEATQEEINRALSTGIPRNTVNSLVRTRCLHSALNAINTGEHTDYWCSQNYRNLDRYMENKNDY